MNKLVQKMGHVAELTTPRHLNAIARLHPQLVALLSAPYFGNLLDISPKIRRQYLTSHLVRSFDLRSRLTAVLHHYRSVQHLLKPEFFAGLLADGVPIWSRTYEEDEYRIVLRHNRTHFYEGDILLILYRGDSLLFQISASIVDGTQIGMGDGNVLLTGSAQGAKPESEDLRHAVRGNAGVAPSHLVMAAVRGVAQALGVDAIAGVGNVDQIIKTQQTKAFSFDYDAFWPMFGGTQTAGGIFAIPVEPFEKPLMEIPRTHRRRSRKKREFKAEVTAQTAHGLALYRRDAATAHRLMGTGDLLAGETGSTQLPILPH